MSAARKILFSGPEGSANIDGLIESLRKTAPGSLARLQESGGRIHGQAVTDDHYGSEATANDCRTTKIEKVQ